MTLSEFLFYLDVFFPERCSKVREFLVCFKGKSSRGDLRLLRISQKNVKEKITQATVTPPI